MSAVAAIGWTVALGASVWAAILRRRLALVARAEHELRGPLCALWLALEGGGRAHTLRAELERTRAAVADLHAARRGKRAAGATDVLELEPLVRGSAASWRPAAHRRGRRILLLWRAGNVRVRADRGRLAQAFGNLLQNALEHGAGDVEISVSRAGDGVRVAVSDAGAGPERLRAQGQGLAIARANVEEAGGRMSLLRERQRGAVAIDLPDAER